MHVCFASNIPLAIIPNFTVHQQERVFCHQYLCYAALTVSLLIVLLLLPLMCNIIFYV